jgi:carboxyl-terminal processing protease
VDFPRGDQAQENVANPLAPEPEPAKEQACPVNTSYDQIVNKAARLIYDPQWLGDLNQLKSKFNCNIKTDEDAIKFADSALKLPGDPYTDVIPNDEATARRNRERGSFKGIGITFAEEKAPGDNERLKGPFTLAGIGKGGPADRAGMKPGDVLASINGVEMSTKTVSETVALIRQNESDDIKVGVIRDGQPLTFEMKREVINVPAVELKMLPGDIAHISMSTFSQHDAAQELKVAIEQAKDAKGYIIDLRDNLGGFVDQALLSASLFVDQGRVLEQRTRSDSPPDKPEYDRITFDLTADKVDLRRFNEKDPDTELPQEEDFDRFPDLVDKPVVILVNGDSASASELFTGALKDNRVATVIGEKTFGKGIGQTTYYGMPHGSWLQMTTFRYYTPNGTWVGDGQGQKIGLTPDIIVPMNPGGKRGTDTDNQLQAALDFLNKK